MVNDAYEDADGSTADEDLSLTELKNRVILTFDGQYIGYQEQLFSQGLQHTSATGGASGPHNPNAPEFVPAGQGKLLSGSLPPALAASSSPAQVNPVEMRQQDRAQQKTVDGFLVLSPGEVVADGKNWGARFDTKVAKLQPDVARLLASKQENYIEQAIRAAVKNQEKSLSDLQWAIISRFWKAVVTPGIRHAAGSLSKPQWRGGPAIQEATRAIREKFDSEINRGRKHGNVGFFCRSKEVMMW